MNQDEGSTLPKNKENSDQKNIEESKSQDKLS